MGIVSLFKWLLGIKRKVPPYPSDFAIIDFSPTALENNITDNENKVIYRHFVNKFGNYAMKKYPYSEMRVHALREVHKIPIYDKTRREVRFPVHARILPSEITYTTR